MRLKLFDYSVQIKPAESKNRKPAVLFMLSLLILSTGLYVLTPTHSKVSMPLFYTIFVLMVVSNLVYFRTKNKSNYLDFDTIFIFIYCLVGFSTTFFYNDRFLFKLLFIGFPVDEEYINRVNLLFLIGLQSYLLGSLSKSDKIGIPNVKPVVINTKILGTGILILSIMFVALGGLSFYKSVYTNDTGNGPGITRHILVLLISTALAIIATEFYNKKISSAYKINRIAIASIPVLIGLLLWAGNRSAASQLLLPVVCLYSLLFRNIKFKQFICILALGIVGMWIIQNTRANVNVDKLINPIILVSDLTIPARTTYCALEYTEQYGHTYGKSMSLGIIAIIPFLPSMIVGESKEFGSEQLLTDYTHTTYKTPVESRIGLGTTIIGDIYLSFGLIGVILLMYFLGCFINRCLLQTLSMNYYSTIIMTGMLAHSVFMVRSHYTFPVRYILWALIIAYFNNHFISNSSKKQKD
jgi:oligosaccharide repeat unit polymerase